MSKSELQPRQDRLVDKYREIGPAALVAALMTAAKRSSAGRNDNRRHSILAAKNSPSKRHQPV
ncbi:hydrolase [Ochrobactrum haematophilum]|uniref:Hydrolase n=1 Tax=Brucella haematophila TaxID=419474 RepID=A0ABX1DQA3_9HYPH|nr:hydrolase [Brucella haematophila]